MLDADRPIQKSGEDRLGRKTFAEYLARCILDQSNPDSLVMGLYGGWGAGKTSVINLVLEELNYASQHMLEDEMPVILNFSAWSYSGQQQLVASFFQRLISEIERAPYFKNSDAIVRLLELYISYFTHQPVSHSKRSRWNPFKRKNKEIGWQSGQDLTVVKAELNRLLKQQKHKIIIFMDNISRLENKEINQIFQMVKSMGDFCNTVYVLALDKQIAVDALNHVHGQGGEDFLEKIIQLSFTIPPITRKDSESILFEGLLSLMNLVPEGAWDKHYWADVYYVGLQYFFNTSRDISRYINTLSFSYVHLKEVVNPVDFFAMTAIDVFEPAVYKGIHDNKDLFTDLADAVTQFNAEKSADDRRRCDEVIARAKVVSREHIKLLLIQLFPHLREIYETKEHFNHSPTIARNNKRICSIDMFDVYFRMSMTSGFLSDGEMAAILSQLNDEKIFALSLLRLNQDNRIPQFLDGLDIQYINKIETKYVGNLISALLDSADLFPEGVDNPISFNVPMKVHRIIHQLLQRFENMDERFKLLQEAMSKAINSVYILVHELEVLGQIDQENADTALIYHEITALQLAALQQVVANKIKHWAEIGRLGEHPKLYPLLLAWKKWGNPTECQAYVSELVKTDVGLLAFLIATLHVPIQRTMTKLTKENDGARYLQNIENFIPAVAIKEHADKLFHSEQFEKLREIEQVALLVFLDLMNKGEV